MLEQLVPIVKLLLLCSFITTGTLAEEQSHYNFVGRGPCPYAGRDWEIRYESRDIRGDTIWVPLFGFGECVPSKYDTPQLREALVPFLGACDTNELYYDLRRDGLTTYNLALRAEYEFAEDTDFVLLKYEVFPLRSYLFVGYVKSSHTIYALSDSYFAPVEAQFNRLVKASPALLNLPPVCRAALVVSLKYGERGIWVFDSITDLFAAEAIRFGGPRGDTLSLHELFVFSPARDSLLMSYFSWHQYRLLDWSFSILHRNQYENSVTIEEPLVQVGEMADTVLLTVCDRMYGELACWEVVFAKNGTVKLADYVSKPVFTHTGFDHCPRLSPYYRNRKSE